MKRQGVFEEGTPVFFSVQNEHGSVLHKEGEVRQIYFESLSEEAAASAYDIMVLSENRLYTKIPACTVRELTAASGAEDGDYGPSAEDMERDFLNTVESLWYGMDPRGDAEHQLPEDVRQLLERSVNENSSGFAVDDRRPPEEDEEKA